MGLTQDAAITGKVKSAPLMDERVGATGINVNTSVGVVSLEGTIASEVQRELAEDVAYRHRAREVHNLLKSSGEPVGAAAGSEATPVGLGVSTQAGASPAAHPDLEEQAKRALAEDSRLNEHFLAVTVRSHTV